LLGDELDYCKQRLWALLKHEENIPPQQLFNSASINCRKLGKGMGGNMADSILMMVFLKE
jgi:hypothetical protein